MHADFDLKIFVLVGDSSVGKSSLLLQFTEDLFPSSYISTIGVDFKHRMKQVDGRNVKVQIWDTAGQERFRAMSSTYYRGAHGIVIVFDITDKKSFEDVQGWLSETAKYAAEGVSKLLVGNKLDLGSSRQVSREEAESLAASNGMLYFETSAKTGQNVEEAILSLVRKVNRGGAVKQLAGTVPDLDIPVQPSSSKGCC
eukprot:c39940_g1_i1.p1 GENE.c39940_g1_i1~~c39940_g1_i1.p1  ORF type:complete len:198 (+),score=39.05 c39940_g1_i1:49-642(+)